MSRRPRKAATVRTIIARRRRVTRDPNKIAGDAYPRHSPLQDDMIAQVNVRVTIQIEHIEALLSGDRRGWCGRGVRVEHATENAGRDILRRNDMMIQCHKIGPHPRSITRRTAWLTHIGSSGFGFGACQRPSREQHPTARRFAYADELCYNPPGSDGSLDTEFRA